MRTTVRLDDELYRQVKLDAASSNRTVGQVVEDAVRVSLAPTPTPAAPIPPLPTFGRGGPVPGVDLGSNAATLDTMDQAVPVDARR